MNIFEQSKEWLSDESMDTQVLMTSYLSYIEEYGQDLSDKFSVDKSKIIQRAEKVCRKICSLIDRFLEGNINVSLQFADNLLRKIRFREIPKDSVFFRARGNDRGYLYEKEEMFHIPFNKRNVIGNQRYSITGVPCLYLGGSAYICWEELSRPVFQTCNFSGFKNRESVYVYDLCLPENIESLDDIERIGIILACSLQANSTDLFKEEYVLPQCLLQAIINRRYSNAVQGIFGVKYISTHVLNNRRQMYDLDIADKVSVNRFTNYVFPSICSGKNETYSPLLTKGFEYTSPCSYTDFLIKNDSVFFGANKDEYLDSFFGMIDHSIRKTLGIIDHWQVALPYCCKPQEDTISNDFDYTGDKQRIN